MLKRRWPLLLAAAALLAALLFYFGPRPRAVEVAAVERRPLTQSVVATGRLATPARVEISSQLAARIDAIAVREGDRVRSGQLLVRLRSDEAQATLAAARAALDGDDLHRARARPEVIGQPRQQADRDQQQRPAALQHIRRPKNG